METIDKIKQFRKEHKNKAISTSHFYSLDDYKIIFPDLLKSFKDFTIDINQNRKKDEVVKITIPLWRLNN